MSVPRQPRELEQSTSQDCCATTSNSIDFLTGGSEMAQAVLAKDWSKTPLGPIHNWPQSLRTTVSLCLASNFPISIAWGPERVQIYNDGYRPICADKHPRSMGQDFKECWFSAWPVIGEAFERAQRGETSYLENRRIFVDRRGFLEETFFTFSFSPIRDESGRVGGLLHPVTETTPTMLAERRTRSLRDLGTRSAKAKTVEEACAAIMQVLAESPLDLPFASLYLFDSIRDGLRLAGFFGIPVDLAETWQVPADLSEAVFEDFGARLDGVQCGPYPEVPRRAIVLPIPELGSDRSVGVFVAGVSSRLPLDDAYRVYYQLLAGHLATALASARGYEEERRKAEALAELDRAKTLFFSNVSHEFRTPLTLMLAPIEELLSQTTADSSVYEQLALVHRNGLRLLKLVNTLLDFSRIEAGRMQAAFEPTDLSQLTIDLASVFRSATERAGLRLLIDCAPLGEPVFVDHTMWEKIVLNLISNAFKFTFDGHIRLSLRIVEQCVELAVEDTGVGIAESELPRIFERFHRIQGVRARTYEGTGIGLALVQELVRIHGGNISVASEPASGSRFTVRIPRGYQHLPVESIQGQQLPNRSSAAQPFLEEALRWLPDNARPGGVMYARPGASAGLEVRQAPRGTVLLADDNADMRDYLRRMLSQHYEVHAVPDGEAAWHFAQEESVDLVLTDVMMPQMDGFELLRQLRSNAHTRSIPVILLSARAGEESRVEGLNAGADDYLIKPFTAPELLARIDSHLRLARIRQEAANLQESELHFRTMADCAPVMLWTCGMDGRCEYLNKSFLDFTGCSDTGNWMDCIHEVDRERCAARFDKAVSHSDSFAAEFRLRRHDGEYRWVQCAGGPRFLPGRGFYGYVLSCVDTHDRIEMEQRIQQLNAELEDRVVQRTAQLEAVNRELEAFSYSVSHDLRAPLRGIDGWSLILAEDYGSQLGPEACKCLDRIRTEAQRMGSLIDDLLELSRVTRSHFRCQAVDLTALSKGIARRLEEANRNRHIEFVIEAGLKATGDSHLLEIVLTNLLENAAKFTGRREKARIEVGQMDSDGEQLFYVRDNGVGFEMKHASTLFSAFQRLHQPSEFPGTGIGLATVQRVVARHGGRVWAEAQPGKGATFFFVLGEPNELH